MSLHQVVLGLAVSTSITTAASAAPLPSGFEANAGQHDAAVAFSAVSAHATLFITADALVTVLPASDAAPGVAVYTRLRGADHRAAVEGLDPLPGRINRLVGAHALTGIPTYGRLRQREVYPGIDLVLQLATGSVEYDFDVGPGADPSRIVLDFEGADSLALAPDGDLLVLAAGRAVHHRRPVAWQTIAGRKVDVDVAWSLADNDTGLSARLALGDYDRAHALVIDPPFAYSTYFGGNNYEHAKGVTTDAEGYIYLTGQTNSSVFPLSPGHLPVASKSGSLAFVSKIDPNAAGSDALVWSTYLGGTNGGESAKDIALDLFGNVYVVGWSTSNTFPTTAGAYQTCDFSNGNGFLSKLAPDGASLLYSTCLAGNNVDEIYGVAVDAAQRAHLVGRSASSDFPTAGGPFQETNTALGLFDVIALIVDTTVTGDGALVYSTYFGECSDDEGESIALDADGVMYLTGTSAPYGGDCLASKWKTKHLTPRTGGGDAWVVKLDPALPADDQMIFSTMLGGSMHEDGQPTGGIGLDAAGNVFVTGATSSADFPVTTANLKSTLGGNVDGFFTVFSPSGQRVYSTYLGGSFNDFARGLRVGSNGLAYITGRTASSDMPTTACTAQAARSGADDGFLLVIDPWSNTLVYSTFIGGVSTDQAHNLALDGDDNAVIVGETVSSNFPVTTDAFQTALAPLGDAFITKVYTPATCPHPAVRIADASVVEGNVGSTVAVVDVHLFGAATAPVTLGWQTFADTADEGVDYLGASGEITFAVGDTLETIEVEVLGDWDIEPDEHFFVKLTALAGDVALQDSLARVRIMNDDAPTSLVVPERPSVDEGSVAVGAGTFTHNGNATALAASIGNVVVDWATSSYTWSFQTSDGPDESQTVTLTLYDAAGPIASGSFGLEVNNVAPGVTLTGPSQVVEGALGQFDFVVTDPGDDGFSAGTPDCGAAGSYVAGSLAATSAGGSFACTFGVGPATSVVAIQVADDEGELGDATFEVSVADLPPSVTLSGPTGVAEGEVVTFDFAYAGGEPAASLSADCDAVGLLVGAIAFDAGTGNGSFQCHFADGPATATVTVGVVDQAQTTAGDGLVVSIANVAPTVALSGATSVDEGTHHTYSFTVIEAGADGFSVDGEPDCGAAGEYLADSLATTSAGGTFACAFPDGPATSEVSLGVSDDDGAAGGPEAPLAVVVANVAPTVAIAGPTGVAEGGTATFTLTVGDPGDDELTIDGISCGEVGALVTESVTLTYLDSALTGTFDCAFGDGPADTALSVAASDSDWAQASATHDVAILELAPIVTVDGPSVVAEGDTASYAFAVDSASGEGFVVVAGYPDCGAAGELVAGSLVVDASGGSFDCLFADGPDASEVAVQVVDDDLAMSNVASLDVSVTDVAPAVSLAGPSALVAGTTGSFAFGISDPGVDDFVLAPGAPSCGSGVPVAGSLVLTADGGAFDCAFPSDGDTVVSVQVASDGLVSDVASVAVSVSPAPPVFGLMSGHGQMSFGGQPVQHGFSLSCDSAAPDQRLQVSWPGGNKFSLDQVATLACSDAPVVDPGDAAPIDTVQMSGQGRLDGVPGASVVATFVDGGEPGSGADYVELELRDASGAFVLGFSGPLQHGNYQAATP